VSATVVRLMMPALLTRISIVPIQSAASAATACHSSGLVTSRRAKRTACPASDNSRSRATPSASSTSAMTTLAPSDARSLTSASPCPRAPPVTMASLFSNRVISGPRLDRVLALAPQLFNAKRDDLSRPQDYRLGFHAHPNARARARGNDVTGLDRHELADIANPVTNPANYRRRY